MTTVDHATTISEIVIRPLDPEGDAAALLAMVQRCSPATLYRRFHGVTRGARATQLLLSGSGNDSFAAWWGDECVGVGGLALGVCGDCGDGDGDGDDDGPPGH